MRIALCDYSGHPFQVELSRCLAARGHSVLHLHFAEFETPKGNLERRPEDPAGFAVEGVRLGRPFDKRKFLQRRRLEARLGALFARRVAAFGPDIVVGCNMPLDAQRRLHKVSAELGAPFVFWLQDIYSKAIHTYLAARLGLLGRAVGRYYSEVEASLLRNSAAVIAISDKFTPALLHWGVERTRIHVIANWAPLSEIYPAAKRNAWSTAHGLDGETVALYTGTLGLKHDPALLLALAQALPTLKVVVISAGPAIDWLAGRKQELGLDNLLLMPFQPMEAYPQVLGAGDILLALVGEAAAGFSVPSKILSYLAAGKPIVASIAAGNDAARTILAAEAGFVVPPGDSAAFIDRVRVLAADPEHRRRCGATARAYAERHFAIETITDRFENVFAGILRPAVAAARLAPLGAG